MSAALDAQVVAKVTKAMSGSRGLWFTRRCLMFALCRRGAWPDPGADLDGCEQAFAAALAAHEQAVGPLARLVRPEQAIPGIEQGELERYDLPEDLFDYAITRVALIERMDLCLMLIANGLHREIELALTVPPAFPSHVWAKIREQLDSGLRTTFLTLSDYGTGGDQGHSWLDSVDALLQPHEQVELAHVGLTMPWISRLGLQLRSEPGESPRSYALIEELPPLRLMRWVYGCIARGAEDVGFG